MKRLASIITAITIMLNVSLAHMSTIKADGYGIKVTSEEGSEIQITPISNNIKGWQVETGNTTVTNNKFTMPGEDTTIKAIILSTNTLTIEMPDFTRIENRTEGESITIEAMEIEGKEFVGWTATGITLTDEQATSAAITITMPGNAVTLVANYSEQAAIIANQDVALGAYITYVPNKTESIVLGTDSGAIVRDMVESSRSEYEQTNDEAEGTHYGKDSTGTIEITESSQRKLVNQIYNPSSTTSWRVLKNNNGQLDIISTESVGDLTLRGATGYAKAVYTLNKLCEDYINTTYADSARNPGYVEGSSLSIINTADYPLTYENTYTNGNNGSPYTDGLWSADQVQIKDTAQVLSSGRVWLASRHWAVDSNTSTNAYFQVCVMSNAGYVGNNFIYCARENKSTYSSGDSYGVRPIVSLKSRIKITGGEGTSTNPYTIEIVDGN